MYICAYLDTQKLYVIKAMGKKPIFKPSKIRNHELWSELEYKDDVVWNTSSLNDYLNTVQLELVNNLLNSDKLKLDQWCNHKILATISLNTSFNTIYLLSDTKHCNAYIAIGIVHPILWYAYDTVDSLLFNLEYILDSYSVKEYGLEFNCQVRAFIGSEVMLNSTMDDLERFLSMNPHTEVSTWGSKWLDYPFRNMHASERLSSHECMALTGQALAQTPGLHHISVRTRYSKSIITIEDHRGLFVLSIQYNSIETPHMPNVIELTNRQLPIDIPIDVVSTIFNFPFIRHTELLQLTPLTTDNFLAASVVANNNEMYKELIDIVEELDDLPDELSQVCDQFVKNLNANIRVDDILFDEEINNAICQASEYAEQLRTSDTRIGEVKEDNVPNLDHIMDNIEQLIDAKLEAFELQDSEFRSYILGIVSGLI